MPPLTPPVLPRRVRLGYGTAELGITGVEVLIRVSLLIFYTDVVGLRADLAAYAVALGVLWDAVTDPLMGVVSDRTRSRFGRRRPYIAVGALALAGAIVVLFSTPSLDTQLGRFIFLALSYIATNTAMTIIAVPHAAMAGDLSDSQPERLTLFGWRLLYANLGLVAGTALPGIAIQSGLAGAAATGDPERFTAYALAAIVLASATATLVSVGARDATMLPGTGRTSTASRARQPDPGGARISRKAYVSSIGQVFTNRPFIPLFVAYLIANIGLSLNSTLALYYYRYRLALEEEQTRLIIVVFMIVFSVSIAGWVWLGQRYGKKWPLAGGVFALGVMSCVTYPFFPAADPHWPMVAAVVGGLSVGAVVLLDAALADVVDYDEVRSRESRFGLYFGLWKMGAKFSRAVAIALAGQWLSLIGLEPNTAPSVEASWLLALAFGPAVGVCFILAALVALLQPLDEARYAKVHRILQRRRARAELILSISWLFRLISPIFLAIWQLSRAVLGQFSPPTSPCDLPLHRERRPARSDDPHNLAGTNADRIARTRPGTGGAHPA